MKHKAMRVFWISDGPSCKDGKTCDSSDNVSPISMSPIPPPEVKLEIVQLDLLNVNRCTLLLILPKLTQPVQWLHFLIKTGKSVREHDLASSVQNINDYYQCSERVIIFQKIISKMNNVTDEEFQKEHAMEAPQGQPNNSQPSFYNNRAEGKVVRGEINNDPSNLNNNQANINQNNPYAEAKEPSSANPINNVNRGNVNIAINIPNQNGNRNSENSYNNPNPHWNSQSANNLYYGNSYNPYPNNYPSNNNPYNNYPSNNYPYNRPFVPNPSPYVPPPPAPIIIAVGSSPQGSVCPVCRQPAPMMAVRQTSMTQWLWCFCIFLCFWPVCCIPFCMSKCDDIRYECSQCRAVRSYYRAPCCP